jgi:hypothetical protein
VTQTTVPRGRSLTHFSGLRVQFHDNLPVSASFEALWDRGSGGPFLRDCEEVDGLGLATVCALLEKDPEWAILAHEHLGDSEPWDTLRERGLGIAVEPLALVRYREELPIHLSTPSPLARDLLLRRVARSTGLTNLPAAVGWSTTLKFMYFPSREYMAWAYRIRGCWKLPLYYALRTLQRWTNRSTSVT